MMIIAIKQVNVTISNSRSRSTSRVGGGANPPTLSTPPDPTLRDPNNDDAPPPTGSGSRSGGDDFAPPGSKYFGGCASVTPLEIDLYQEIMKYRGTKGLDSIPFSSTLAAVAFYHAECSNRKGSTPGCNMHSWLAHPAPNVGYTPCCYDGNPSCMWRKPLEISKGAYKDFGYEISAATSGTFKKGIDLLKMWQGSPGHNAVIVNEGSWENHHWKAIGVAVVDGFSHVVFATGPDLTDAGNCTEYTNSLATRHAGSLTSSLLTALCLFMPVVS
eukprot:GHVU01130244.1.p1 GENE.GHVU01130244.1~~GHVU01130244.1.p1  ORF type:complete len:272 (+),score=29.73 GHVU01130244.1:532-1347(+)